MEVPGFEIRRTIGRGGMATAYLALQQSLGREVVLKAMDMQLAEASSDFVERFMNEGRIVASLRHPHIITVFDIGRTDETVWLAMEYVDGGDLKSRISGPQAPDKALEIIEHIGSALDYAHRRNVIHRDVKPANVLFRGDGTALLSDFGIAKQVSIDAELTSTGTILGSPFYMSPEQAEGLVVDGRADVYSLGVIFYELLTGERPYTGDSAIKVIMQHIQAPLPKLPANRAHYQDLLERMMSKSRDQRFADAGEMVREVARLRKMLRGDTDATRKVDPTASAKRPRLRLAALAGMALVLVIAGLGAYLAYASSLRPSIVRRPASAGEVTAVDQNALAGARERVARESRRAAADGAATTDATVSRNDVIKALLWLAENGIREDRLTQPPAENALYYYSRLLALDPDNETARRGLSAIADRFVTLAEQEYSRRNYGKAQAYIALGLQVEPENEGLRSLQSFIDERRDTFIDRVLGIFRG